MMAALTITFVFFGDEYLIVFIPGSIYLALRLGPIKRLGWWLGLATGLIIMLYGLIGLGDYLAWNTASWAAGEQLIAQGVTPQAIDGGFEWIGWYDFETALPHAIANGQGDDLMAWMSITPKEYLLSFEPLAGHDVISRVTYHTPLIGREGSIYVLRR